MVDTVYSIQSGVYVRYSYCKPYWQYRKDKHVFRDKLVVRLAVQKVYPFFITVICIGMCNTNPQKVDQALPFY